MQAPVPVNIQEQNLQQVQGGQWVKVSWSPPPGTTVGFHRALLQFPLQSGCPDSSLKIGSLVYFKTLHLDSVVGGKIGVIVGQCSTGPLDYIIKLKQWRNEAGGSQLMVPPTALKLICNPSNNPIVFCFQGSQLDGANMKTLSATPAEDHCLLAEDGVQQVLQESVIYWEAPLAKLTTRDILGAKESVTDYCLLCKGGVQQDPQQSVIYWEAPLANPSTRAILGAKEARLVELAHGVSEVLVSLFYNAIWKMENYLEGNPEGAIRKAELTGIAKELWGSVNTYREHCVKAISSDVFGAYPEFLHVILGEDPLWFKENNLRPDQRGAEDLAVENSFRLQSWSHLAPPLIELGYFFNFAVSHAFSIKKEMEEIRDQKSYLGRVSHVCLRHLAVKWGDDVNSPIKVKQRELLANLAKVRVCIA